MDTVLREAIFTAVHDVNERLVLEGMDGHLERYVPLLETTAQANAYIVYFFGQPIFHTEENIMIEGTYDAATIEKILYQGISDVRSVVNHVTAAINPVGL